MASLRRWRNIVRLTNVVWGAVLICFMAIGSFSTARIGAMTWGPQHDVWSATIAISQINFGLSGKLGYREIGQAIVNEVTSSKNVWSVFDDQTRALLGDPAVVTRGLRAGAAVAKSDIASPTSKFDYVADWCEDLGYADFYNLAFRLFGVSAFSTHWLYFSILVLTFILFVLVFIQDDLAIATVSLAITALFISSCSSIFSELLPSFAANRFLSTLVIVPLLFAIFSAIQHRPLTPLQVAALITQALIVAFAMAARSSAQWFIVAFIVATATVIVIRKRRNGDGPKSGHGLRGRTAELTQIPYFQRLAITVGVFLLVGVAYSATRNAQFDERYFWEENLPHHLFWHSAYLGLVVHPEWPQNRPYADQTGGDTVGFRLFEHRMTEQGRPFARGPYYLARTYEPFIKREYMTFALTHPRYVFELMLYYKPEATAAILATTMTSAGAAARVAALISIALATILLYWRARLTSRREFLICIFFLWGGSLLPVFWAYPAVFVMADQLWASLFLLLVLISLSAELVVRGIVSFVCKESLPPIDHT